MKEHEQPADEAPESGASEPLLAVPFPLTWSQFLDQNWKGLALNLDSIESTTYSAALADECSSIVDEIADLHRAEARQQAWLVERIDEARRVSEATLHGVLTLESTLSVAKQQEMARRSLVAELACALRMPERTVIGMLTDAEALMHRLPTTMTALRAGEISYRHAKMMVDQTATLTPEAALVLEAQAVPFATTLTVSKFRAKTRLLRERLDPDSIAARVTKSAQDRRLDFQPADDGMAWLSLYTTAPEATSIYIAVRDHALAVQNPADSRTLTQLTADVFTDAVSAALCGELPANAVTGSEPTSSPKAQGARPSGSGSSFRSGFGSGAAFSRIRPTVTVTIPALTLLGKSEEPGMLEGYGPIDADTARDLAGQSDVWYRMLTDPTTGVPVALDRTKYRPTKRMKDAEARISATTTNASIRPERQTTLLGGSQSSTSSRDAPPESRPAAPACTRSAGRRRSAPEYHSPQCDRAA